MQAALHKEALPVIGQGLEGRVFARANLRDPLASKSQGGSAQMPMGIRARMLEAKLASSIRVANCALLPRGGHGSGFNPRLRPLSTCKGGSKRGTVLPVPAYLPQLLVSFRYRGRQVEKVQWREGARGWRSQRG